jgi:DNA-directed RNA polymerase specialized sigma24 family protein
MEADSAAEFAVFYQASMDRCLRAVLASVGDRQLAEDLVSEGFVRALMAWRKVRQHPAPGAWVVRTALNTRISWSRRHRREVPLTGGDAPALPGPEPVMDAALLAEVRQLPLRQREVIALRVFLDLDTQTTAAVLGIAPGTVGAHLSRAVATLRGHMSSHISDNEEATT